MIRKKIETFDAKKRLKAEIKPYTAKITILTVLSVLSSLLSVSFAFFTQYLVNGASNGDNRLILTFSIILAIVVILRISLKSINSLLTEKYRAEMSATLSKKAFSRALKGNYSKLSEFHSGEALNRILSDSREIAADTTSIVPVTAGLAAQLAGCLLALFAADKLFTFILILGGLLIFSLSALFKKTLKRYQKEIMSLDGKTKSFMQETLTSSLTIKAYSAEDNAVCKADELLSSYTKKRVDRAKTYSFVNVLYSLISNAGLLFAIIWCSLSVLNGSMEYGAILSVVLLMEQLQRPLTSFSSVMPVVYSRAASAERLFELTDAAEEIKDGQTVSYENLKSIRLNGVSFAYGKTAVFENFSAEFKKGEFTCVVGRSGIGKSTLFKLLLAVYDPTDGKLTTVTENGEREISARDRDLFAYVPQGNFLFSGTIRENLTFFCKKTPSDADIDFAIKTALADFVYDLPERLETQLTERGGGLSEGQIQRLALARAILSDRPILLLDETTSALDETTETALLKNLNALTDKTIIMITHRSAAIKTANSVLKLD